MSGEGGEEERGSRRGRGFYRGKRNMRWLVLEAPRRDEVAAELPRLGGQVGGLDLVSKLGFGVRLNLGY